jgi:hypothetical protein
MPAPLHASRLASVVLVLCLNTRRTVPIRLESGKGRRSIFLGVSWGRLVLVVS